MKKILSAGLIAIGVAVGLSASLTRVAAQQGGGATGAATAAVTVDADDIGGVVRCAKGPEAGVWVIAETTEFPTKFARIVVTDDRGRYLLPYLPKASYKVWVRGYGLVDSKPVQAAPGKTLNLQAVTAPSPKAAAQYYPASYWYSLLQPPPKSAFPMEREGIQNQLQWIATLKSAIQFYQVGYKATREVPEKLGKFKSTREALSAWIETGEAPTNFFSSRVGADVVIADWLDRIAAGEVPPAPPRPQGVERNVVVTLWDWSTEKGFIHDVMTTDSRNPTLNANGLIYGPEQYSGDTMVALDPIRNAWVSTPVPMRDTTMIPNYQEQGRAKPGQGDVPLTWGKEIARPAKMRLHNMMFDQKGRLWTTGKFRKGEDQPDFCKQGANHPSAKFFPIARNNDLDLLVYDPKTKQFTMVDTCYGTMHLEFAEDADNTLWTSGGAQVIGFLNTKVYDETHDVAKAQGWCPYILDTNGNGKVDPGWVDPGAVSNAFGRPAESAGSLKVDPTKDLRIRGGSYGIAYNPVDGTIWEGTAAVPGFILRISPGSNPPNTCLTEIYNSPPGASTPKGVYADRSTGVIWVAFAGSNQFASFDRRKCKVLNGPTATGNHCPEGWTLYPAPGPRFKGVTDDIGADWLYLNWVDQFDTLGLGKNVPLAPGTNSDSMMAFLPDSKKFVTMHVPYPLGFYSRGMDGRIDDTKAGWKGKGLWTTYASISPWNVEGGKGTRPKVVKFQIRPDPLAH